MSFAISVAVPCCRLTAPMYQSLLTMEASLVSRLLDLARAADMGQGWWLSSAMSCAADHVLGVL